MNHFSIDREQSILKTNLVLQDDHPNWSLALEQTATDESNPFQVKSTEGLKYIGGVDLSFIVGNKEDAIASLIVLSYPKFEVSLLCPRRHLYERDW